MSDSPLILSKHDERLGSGMKVGEAVKRAAEWWEKSGRAQMRKVANKERRKGTFTASGAGPAIIVRGEEFDVIPSGIFRALPWDQLTERERLNIVKTWHHHFVVIPNHEQRGGLVLQ